MDSEQAGRHFTVAVFVVWEGKVLLHRHRKLVLCGSRRAGTSTRATSLTPAPGVQYRCGREEVFSEVAAKVELS
jgi:hypothetical protein